MFTSSARSPLTVLFVDPDRARSEQLAQPLRATCRIGMVSSATIAMEVLYSQPPDLLITELDLPDASGAEFIRRVHSDPQTKDILIMVVTSRASVRDKIAALLAGADDFLVRPLAPEQFAMKVQLLGRFRRIVGR
jgi:two-component system, OmpR family, phosphate regulon response regulator PhoB